MYAISSVMPMLLHSSAVGPIDHITWRATQQVQAGGAVNAASRPQTALNIPSAPSRTSGTNR